MLSELGVRVIGPPEFVAGFALAGIPGEEALVSDEGVERLTTLLDDRSVGVVIADEALARALPDLVRRRIDRRPTPVLVPVPRPRWGAGGEEAGAYILDLLQRAVGYRLRLR